MGKTASANGGFCGTWSMTVCGAGVPIFSTTCPEPLTCLGQRGLNPDYSWAYV
jgi:hypothetical protein